MKHEDVIISVANILNKADRVFMISGAGLSAPSGLQTFRGSNGYWNNISLESLASCGGFEVHPEASWDWYNERIEKYLAAEPNAGHYAIVEIQENVKNFDHATQLVDGLLNRAGARNLLELYGNIFSTRCTNCKEKQSLNKPFDIDNLYHACGGRLKPGVIQFGEDLPNFIWSIAKTCKEKADVIIVVGTSGIVYPAASLTRTTKKNAVIVEINIEPTLEKADFVIKLGAEVALPQIVKYLKSIQSQ